MMKKKRLSNRSKTVNISPRATLKADIKMKVKMHRKRLYDEPVKKALTKIRQILGFPCGKGLKVMLKEEVRRSWKTTLP